MHRLSLLPLALLLSSCDSGLEKTIDFFTGRKTSVVVLVKQPIKLTPAGTTLNSEQPMKVLGEWTSVCLSLRGGVQDAKTMDLAYQQLMQSAKVTIFLNLGSGTRVRLTAPNQAWSKRGKVLAEDELAACASTPCKAELPVGSEIRSVEISSEPSLNVEGIFWESETDLNPKPTVPPQTAASSAATGHASCSARGA